MIFEKPSRRLTLRQQLTHVEKLSRDVIEYLNGTLLPNVNDLRDLSRPIRRKSHYPTMVAMSNALNKLASSGTEIAEVVDYLQEQLQEIREHSRRERLSRK